MRYLLVIIALPSILLGHIYVALILALGMARSPRYESYVITAVWRPWVDKRWRYSTTIGHGIGYRPLRRPPRGWLDNKDFATSIAAHEHVHTRQYEDLCCLGLLISCALLPFCRWELCVILYSSSGALWLVGNYGTALLRGKHAYRGTQHELSAYAQTRDPRGFL